MTLDGECPNAKTRKAAVGCTYEHYCYKQWCTEQQQLRVQHVSGKLPAQNLFIQMYFIKYAIGICTLTGLLIKLYFMALQGSLLNVCPSNQTKLKMD